jgi:dienelactone hydrolase
MVAQAKTRPGCNASAMALDKWQSPEFEHRYGIPFERIAAPVLVQAAGADAVWPSWVSAAMIQKRFAAHGRSKQAEIHVYPDAGHNMVQMRMGSPLTLSGYDSLPRGFMAFGCTPKRQRLAALEVVYSGDWGSPPAPDLSSTIRRPRTALERGFSRSD